MQKSLLSFVNHQLGNFIVRHNFVVGNEEKGSMGEASLRLDNPEFWIEIIRDRGGYADIAIGCKIRPRPRAHLRWWPLGHFRGYLEDHKDHYIFSGLEDQARWLEEHEKRLLDSSLLYSQELHRWAVNTSRRRWAVQASHPRFG